MTFVEMLKKTIDEVDRGQQSASGWIAQTDIMRGFAERSVLARAELGEFNVIGRPLAECIREMRVEMEKYRQMIDDLVREIVTR